MHRNGCRRRLSDPFAAAAQTLSARMTESDFTASLLETEVIIAHIPEGHVYHFRYSRTTPSACTDRPSSRTRRQSGEPGAFGGGAQGRAGRPSGGLADRWINRHAAVPFLAVQQPERQRLRRPSGVGEAARPARWFGTSGGLAMTIMIPRDRSSVGDRSNSRLRVPACSTLSGLKNHSGQI